MKTKISVVLLFLFIATLFRPAVLFAVSTTDSTTCESQKISIDFQGLKLGMSLDEVKTRLEIKGRKVKIEHVTHLYSRTASGGSFPLKHPYYTLSYKDVFFGQSYYVYLEFTSEDNKLYELSIKFPHKPSFFLAQWKDMLTKQYGEPCGMSEYNKSCYLWGPQPIAEEKEVKEAIGDYIIFSDWDLTFSNRNYYIKKS